VSEKLSAPCFRRPDSHVARELVLTPSKPNEELVVMVELRDYSAGLIGESVLYPRKSPSNRTSGLSTSPEPEFMGAHVIVECGWDAPGTACQSEREYSSFLTTKADLNCRLAMWAGGAAGLVLVVLIFALAIVGWTTSCTLCGVS
jgi:hypothetical protein